ncbi:MAG: OmpA family protein [Deltaproteobacteria bacterium]|nr:MAG: OmpA family protein [Deltaproteobacteria bacterium]
MKRQFCTFGTIVMALFLMSLPSAAKDSKDKDTDKDGVIDRLDKCPTVPGPKSNAGCPRPKVVIRKRNCGPTYSKVYFEQDQSDLTKRHEALLMQGVFKLMKKHGNIVVLVEGHTNSKYTFKRALKLSRYRAKAVRDFLVKKGIAAGRLKIRGYGYTRPLTTNRTKRGRSLNERVDFLVLSRKWKPKSR